MKISYNWLNEYLPAGEAGLPEKIEPQKLSGILTSIGLEVEALEFYENVKGSLQGLVVGEVISCEPHPNADKLKLTKVDINAGEPLQIVCGAPNVATGQKVIVAPVGTTMYPLNNDPLTMKVAKIRGIESFGMICAEDEIGIGSNHSGILILPDNAKTGSPAGDHFNVYTDWIFEIGLTPNRMDAMSHIGVAKDVCAWLSHHTHKTVNPKLPYNNDAGPDLQKNLFGVIIENTEDCKRYSALNITGITVGQSPEWMQNFLKAIGQRPINNIVDITNFVLHETGQPLHAFNADAITSNKVVVKNLPEGTSFITLDGTERKLSSRDLMICNNDKPVCIAGVFGGIGSGVTDETKSIFLESAWFSPSTVRETSFRHGLRTEAAVRFEKGVDISGTVQALNRAAMLIKEIAGGKINGNVIDVYPSEIEKKQIVLKYDYLEKLSGKVYSSHTIKNILSVLGFDIIKENENELKIAAPLSKPDIALPADVVEEVVRIDGLDNIEIPSSITISPSAENNALKEQLKEKLSQLLVGFGFNEIITNSITNSKNFSEDILSNSVRLLNNLSAELDILRPVMLETGLEILAYNINRKNANLRLFEFGKTYRRNGNEYAEDENICFWITGKHSDNSWKQKNNPPDFFTAKGIITSLLSNINIHDVEFAQPQTSAEGIYQNIIKNDMVLGKVLQVQNSFLQRFDIHQPVVFAEFNYQSLSDAAQKQEIIFKEIPQFPAVERDLALIIDKRINFASIEKSLKKIKLPFLQQFHLFDIFESDKIGTDKKSLAINFTFLNPGKTLTDNEVESMIQKIIKELEINFNAEIRK
jgi:phenylalanyl-tRNA synthetase beta chain